jgi:hypothetical protein
LEINAQKSKVVIFTHRYGVTLDQPLLYKNSALPVVDSVKYLGVYLDSKLSWSTHLQKKIFSANHLQFIAKKYLADRHGGLNTLLTSWIFTSIVRPKLLYASLVWASSATSRKCNISKLEKIYRSSARAITGTSKCAPLASTSVMANIEPILISVQRSALMSNYLVQSTSSKSPITTKGKFTPHTLYGKHLESHILKDQFPLIDRTLKPYFNIDRKFKIVINQDTDIESFHSLEGCSLVYTDGSRCNDKGRSGSG